MRPTASTLWLAELCPASHVLQQVRETSAAQERGTAVHRYLERAPAIGKEAALAELPEEYRELCAEIEPEQIPRGQREVAIGYDLETRAGRLLGTRGRLYPDDLACGTIDLLGELPCVWDYKTGRPCAAADSLQLQALGLYAARTFGWDWVEVGHLRLDGDRMRPDHADLGPMALVAAHERIAAIYERHEQAKAQAHPDVYPGEHCTSCAAAPACPATTALTLRAAQAVQEVSPGELSVEDEAIDAWEFLGRVEDLADRLRAEIKRRAALAPIPLGNGKQLELVPVEKSSIKGKVALPILREAIGNVDAACSISKTGLAKVAGKRGAAILIERLTAVGAVETWTEQHLRETKIPPCTRGDERTGR